MADLLENYEDYENIKKYPSWLRVKSYEGFTYKEYLRWGEDIRVELIDGIVYMMAGTSERHQSIAGDIFLQLKLFFKDKPCKPYFSPFDVRLFPKEDLMDKTVVQPDILVVCDKSKIHEKGINGAPDFIIEIMSPSSEGHDLITKKKLYESAGVREYWVVGEKQVYQYYLVNGKFAEIIHDLSLGQKIASCIFEGLMLGG